MAIEKLRIN